MKHSIIIASTAAFILTACSQQTFVLDSQYTPNNGDLYFSDEVFHNPKGAKLVQHEHFFLSGIGQGQAVNATKVCGSASRVAKVEVKQNVLQSILALVTFGIYTPREASVYCR
jgi:hypothetical protein